MATKTHLTWTPGANDVAFNVYRVPVAADGTLGSAVKINASPVTSPVYDDPYAGLAPGKYNYDVTGINGGGVESAPSNVASATVPFPDPGVPTNLVAAAA